MKLLKTELVIISSVCTKHGVHWVQIACVGFHLAWITGVGFNYGLTALGSDTHLLSKICGGG